MRQSNRCTTKAQVWDILCTFSWCTSFDRIRKHPNRITQCPSAAILLVDIIKEHDKVPILYSVDIVIIGWHPLTFSASTRRQCHAWKKTLNSGKSQGHLESISVRKSTFLWMTRFWTSGLHKFDQLRTRGDRKSTRCLDKSHDIGHSKAVISAFLNSISAWPYQRSIKLPGVGLFLPLKTMAIHSTYKKTSRSLDISYMASISHAQVDSRPREPTNQLMTCGDAAVWDSETCCNSQRWCWWRLYSASWHVKKQSMNCQDHHQLSHKPKISSYTAGWWWLWSCMVN